MWNYKYATIYEKLSWKKERAKVNQMGMNDTFYYHRLHVWWSSQVVEAIMSVWNCKYVTMYEKLSWKKEHQWRSTKWSWMMVFVIIVFMCDDQIKLLRLSFSLYYWGYHVRETIKERTLVKINQLAIIDNFCDHVIHVRRSSQTTLLRLRVPTGFERWFFCICAAGEMPTVVLMPPIWTANRSYTVVECKY